MQRQSIKRRRPALSCNECRRRKIKCDRNDPCRPCATANELCVYKNGTKSPLLSHQHDGPYPSHDTTTAINLQPPTSNAPQMTQEHQSAGHFSDSQAPAITSQDILTLRSNLRDAQISTNKSRVLRWSYWSGAAQEFATIFSCYVKYSNNDDDTTVDDDDDDELAALVASIRELLAKCKTLASVTKLSRPTRSLSSPDFPLLPPSRELANIMVSLYLQCFESAFRILHIPSFQAEYTTYWENTSAVPISLNLKVLLVIAIGSSLTVSDATFRNMSHQWIYASETWLSGPLEKNRLDINGIQIHCLTILARQVLSIGSELTWVSMGSLLHKGMQIGLHRDPNNFAQMSLLQAEMRRRLWATILELTIQASLDSGMTSRIFADEYDTKAPSNINDEDMDDSTAITQPSLITIYTTSSMQIKMLESLPTRVKICKLLYGLHPALSYVEVLELSSEMSKMCQSAKDFSKIHAANGVSPFHRNFLDFLTRRFLLPLHLPFAGQASINPLFSYSLQLGADVAMAMGCPEPDECYSNLWSIAGGWIKETIRRASLMFGAKLLAEAKMRRCDGFGPQFAQQNNVYKEAMNDLMSLSLRRIKSGETNVKAHMFMAMILAEVDAIEADTPCESKIAQSTRESLETCHKLLSEYTDKVVLAPADHEAMSLLQLDEDGYGSDFDMDTFLPIALPTLSY